MKRSRFCQWHILHCPAGDLHAKSAEWGDFIARGVCGSGAMAVASVPLGRKARDRARRAEPVALAKSSRERLRERLLHGTRFDDLCHARTAVRAWRDAHDTCRPHSAQGNPPPARFAPQIGPGERAA